MTPCYHDALFSTLFLNKTAACYQEVTVGGVTVSFIVDCAARYLTGGNIEELRKHNNEEHVLRFKKGL